MCRSPHVPYKSIDDQRRFQRERLAERRRQWLDAHGPCRWCGTSEALEVDHVDPSTKVHHNVWSWAEARRLEELAKCQVLCHNCHIAKTAQENSVRNGGLTHGTEAMYGKRRCRCGDCRSAWNAAKSRRRKERTRLGLPRDGRLAR